MSTPKQRIEQRAGAEAKKRQPNAGPAEAPEVTPPPPAPEWPAPPAAEAFHGLMGQIVSTLEPETEADPVALLVQGLVMFGNVIGRNAYYRVENTRHHTNLFAALVGHTGEGRKGTGHDRMKPLFRPIDDHWLLIRNADGASSSEGLLHQVRDANEKTEDEGEPDKRLMLTETEFINVLKQAERQGNTLSPLLRKLWDGPEVVQTLTRNSPLKASAPHVSMIGHITPTEIDRSLTSTEVANGFGNRILLPCVRRSKLLPFGGSATPPGLPALSSQLEAAAGFAQAAGEVTLAPAARPIWEAVYQLLTRTRVGLAEELLARAAPLTLRLAMLYALLDRSPVIHPCHLVAGIALWDYCERSVRFLFGDKTGNPLADEIREMLRNAPAGLTRSDLNKAMGNHAYGDRLTTALNALRSAGLARCERTQTQGRPAERWFSAARAGGESQLIEISRGAFSDCVESVESVQSHHPGVDGGTFPRFKRFPRTLGPDTGTPTFSGQSAPPPPPRVPKPAEVWLVNQLRNGPRPVAEVDAVAKKAGVNANTIRMIADKVLGIVPRELRPGCWSWELPAGFDMTPYPAPREPPKPTLVDDVTPPATVAPTTKRKAGKRKTAPPKPAEETAPADKLKKQLRKAGRTWAEVAAFLDAKDEYYPADLELRGLTPAQLTLVAQWLETEM